MTMNQTDYLLFAACFLLTFCFTVLISRRLIPRLKSLKIGQKILEIGPRWHKNKEDTPTMGGLAFLFAVLLSAGLLTGAVFLFFPERRPSLIRLWLTLFLAVGSGLVGLVDDWHKITKKQNEGLTAARKFLLQIVVAGIYLLLLRVTVDPSTVLHLPFISVDLDLGIFYYLIALVLITGIVNSVNLTDGIDGLASSETFVVGAFFAVVSFTVGSFDGAIGSAFAVGAALGFLVYNYYPARVFMGDTGSLFLGGLLSALAFAVGNPLLVLFGGLMFVIETVSVMIQTTYFKYTRIRRGEGKRIFKMTPIHHHFEMCGWKETKIVFVFSAAALIFCTISYILEYIL